MFDPKKKERNFPGLARPVGYLSFLHGLNGLLEENGYLCAVSGSMRRDYDMVAVAWTSDAVPAPILVEKVRQWLGGKIQGDEGTDPHDFTKRQAEPKMHGRYAWSIYMMGDLVLDLSIIGPEPDAISRYMDRMDKAVARFKQEWTLPHVSQQEVTDRIEKLMAERDWPASGLQCARIGYEIARRMLMEQGMDPMLGNSQFPQWTQWFDSKENLNGTELEAHRHSHRSTDDSGSDSGPIV